MQDVNSFIQQLVDKYKYRPLPKAVKGDAHAFYHDNLNGFDKKRDLLIDGRPFAMTYERIVVGDYGAYVEIKETDLLQPLTVPENQKWRLNEEYVKSKNITLKYYWLECQGKKVYHQIGGVKYADYKAGLFYISVTDFDTPSEVSSMNPIFSKLSEHLITNGLFTHTDTTAAEAFLSEIADLDSDKINVAIVGDEDISDGRQVSRCLNMLLRIFEYPENVRILTGEMAGVESIVRRWAKRNLFETDIYPLIEKPDWLDTGYTNREERDRRMATPAHVVIVITKPRSNSCDFMYSLAVESGRFVSHRYIRKIS